ncbi:hypothetical protein GCWU000342_00380 [Shuttleworthella satelles DSM 14600]|uniref:Uncharacterized protein n=1 Tax=Shuttleworthella satelles DSM 14600 TaxID=626523 RepID=C4G8T4_9FIRM|nr:hypothetical protein GCWU000342_00380 [Shuttleworthia satelles DSM 14600]
MSNTIEHSTHRVLKSTRCFSFFDRRGRLSPFSDAGSLTFFTC